MPDPPGFVVKNGTKRFDVFARPGPSSRIKIIACCPERVQPTVTEPLVSRDASAALRIRLINS